MAIWWNRLRKIKFDYDIIRFRFFGLRNRKIYETFFKKNENECLKLLNKKRKGILDEVHLKEKQLSRIDYLRYEMDRGNKKWKRFVHWCNLYF